MRAANRQLLICSAALLLLAAFPPGRRAFASEGPLRPGGRCQAHVHAYLAQAPAVARANERITRLLDARRYRQAAAALRSAAARYQDAWAGYTLGHLYAAGLGAPRNAGTAFRWYLWAAKRGDRFAQRQVANAYLNGDGVRRNAAEAAYWFRIGIAPWQLAVMNDSLSRTYARGHLAPVNQSKSAYYLQQSVTELRELAREPNGQAAYYLGLDYEHGRGVPQSRKKAMKLLCRAAGLRYAPAIKAIHQLEERP